MIVACSACATRFRVPDEKVGPRGARVRCTRCGETFSVAPAPPQDETTQEIHDPGGTGGWPAGALEDAGRPGTDPGSTRPVADDPFAGFAAPTQGLSLEERTASIPIRESLARWGDPEPVTPIRVGPDGFHEVDLARLDLHEEETTQGVPLAPALPPVPVPVPVPSPAIAPPAPTESAPIRPARTRALAMNLLSLAALPVVTLGIVLWWRGDTVGSFLRSGRADGPAFHVGSVASGVYEGTRGAPVLFVRGVVRASQPVNGPLAVRVHLERGGAPLGSAVVAAGAVPSAEEVALATSPDDLLALRLLVDSRAPGRIEPGRDMPFLAVFPMPAGDPGAIRFRIDPVAPQGP
ncbi:MAG: zinc-ribbon domain-containing protein [Deltaproteobacteria bacterium]